MRGVTCSLGVRDHEARVVTPLKGTDKYSRRLVLDRGVNVRLTGEGTSAFRPGWGSLRGEFRQMSQDDAVANQMDRAMYDNHHFLVADQVKLDRQTVVNTSKSHSEC